MSITRITLHCNTTNDLVVSATLLSSFRYAHFSAAHYPCEHNDCLAKRFVVFKTDDDLKIHEVTEHTNFGGTTTTTLSAL